MILNLQASKQHATNTGFLYMVALINMLNTPIDPTKLSAIVAQLGAIPSLSLSTLTIAVDRT
jgi:hypothetical protein